MNWPNKGEVALNWGDKLNPYLAELITGKKVINRKDIYPNKNVPVHYWIGSHLEAACNDPRAVVWGAGFIRADSLIGCGPGSIHAVRGRKSAAKLRNAGIIPPEAVGDPALLMPKFYRPVAPAKRYRYGFISHFRESKELFFLNASKWEDTLIIDITGGITDVIDQIVSCDFIFSSSLHGIICADAYAVPAFWIKVSSKVLGDGFKFYDYFSGVGRPERPPILVCEQTSQVDLESQLSEYSLDIDIEALWNACPDVGGRFQEDRSIRRA